MDTLTESSIQSAANLELALEAIEAAGNARLLSPSSVANVRKWLTEPCYSEFTGEIARHISLRNWPMLDEVFWRTLPFGTGGRRGLMCIFGTNAINERTVAECAGGLAECIRHRSGPNAPMSCAIAYDTRHGSRHFAEVCAEVMASAGFFVHFLAAPRSTPQLSFAVRHCRCDCGLMVTASHNPPGDNGVKVYWSNGGQVLPPHDVALKRRVERIEHIDRVPFTEAIRTGRIVSCQRTSDAAYVAAVVAQGFGGPRELRVLYSPMHGTGASSVVPVLRAAGFREVELYGPHVAQDADFPNVPNGIANPERPETMQGLIDDARKGSFDIALATDPDADRLGCAAPAKWGGPWQALTGNEIGTLLTDYVLESRRRIGRLSPTDFVAKSIVTSNFVTRIAQCYGVSTIGALPVGFKWIAEAIDRYGPDRFVFGVEESHGYLAGTYVRDKDAAVAALLLAELAAREHQVGRTLHDKLDVLFRRHGCHIERTHSIKLPGRAGFTDAKQIMKRLRQDPPAALAGLPVVQVRDTDWQTGATTANRVSLPAEHGDQLMFDLSAEGHFVTVRPSGTEPKLKVYLFAYQPPEQIADLATTKAELAGRLDQMATEVFGYLCD